MSKPENSIDTIKFNAIWLPAIPGSTEVLYQQGVDAIGEHVLWPAGSTDEAFNLKANFLELALFRLMKTSDFPKYTQSESLQTHSDSNPLSIKSFQIRTSENSAALMMQGEMDLSKIAEVPGVNKRMFLFGRPRQVAQHQFNGAMNMWLAETNRLLATINHPPIPSIRS